VGHQVPVLTNKLTERACNGRDSTVANYASSMTTGVGSGCSPAENGAPCAHRHGALMVAADPGGELPWQKYNGQHSWRLPGGLSQTRLLRAAAAVELPPALLGTGCAAG